MSVPTWREAETYAEEYRREGDTEQAEWWANYAKEVKDCTYDAGLYPDKDGYITYDSGRREKV